MVWVNRATAGVDIRQLTDYNVELRVAAFACFLNSSIGVSNGFFDVEAVQIDCAWFTILFN